MTERLGDERWIEVLRAHNALFRRQSARARRLRGEEPGRRLHARLPRPGRAVECATAIQRSSRAREPAEGERIRVRMGLHSGRGDPRGGRLLRPQRDPRRADRRPGARRRDPRLRGAARARRAATDGLDFDAGRELELKGLAGTHRVYRADWEAGRPPPEPAQLAHRPDRLALASALDGSSGWMRGRRGVVVLALRAACARGAGRSRSPRFPGSRPGREPAAQHAQRPRLRPLRGATTTDGAAATAPATSTRTTAPSASAPTRPTTCRRLPPHSRRPRHPLPATARSSTRRAGERERRRPATRQCAADRRRPRRHRLEVLDRQTPTSRSRSSTPASAGRTASCRQGPPERGRAAAAAARRRDDLRQLRLQRRRRLQRPRLRQRPAGRAGRRRRRRPTRSSTART